MKKICDLVNCDYDIEIYGITDDSRYVKDGYLFVASKGFNVDHFDYIEDAIDKGCSFIISDRDINIDFPHIIVEKDISKLYRKICEKFYDVDFNKINMIGITGTDGKTTTTSIIKELISDCAYIGTNGFEIKDKSFSTNNTTPVVSELYDDISKIIKSNCKNLAMEVSSEALLHGRVDDFRYKVVGITNITGDHMNVHKTFDNYVLCKKKILTLLKSEGYAVLNGDDEILTKINGKNVVKFGFNTNNDCIIENVEYLKDKTIINIKYNNEIVEINSPLKARYNVYNVVMAYIICRLFGIDSSLLLSRIKKLRCIKGRTELLDFGQDYDIILDYAHTINGIRNVLDSFQNYKKIITVTGCAGGREKEKRPIIGKMVIDRSDVSIFTMDDPRYESVDDIIDQMVGKNEDYIRIIDREEAIEYALDIASKDSVVLILGKGRDNYMAINDKKVYYSDYDVISNYFKEK